MIGITGTDSFHPLPKKNGTNCRTSRVEQTAIISRLKQSKLFIFQKQFLTFKLLDAAAHLGRSQLRSEPFWTGFVH
jgi:hypothetical protein